MDKVLCTHCIYWVDCTKEKKPKGFCVLEPLFSYTAKESCEDYKDGTPITEQQYEDFNANIY